MGRAKTAIGNGTPSSTSLQYPLKKLKIIIEQNAGFVSENTSILIFSFVIFL